MIPRRMRGQALTEFLVIGLVLIPLFLLLPTIGKYLDIAHATQMASRYVAFEAMQRNSGTPAGWKPPEQLAGEVRRRYFSNSTAPIKTGDTAGDFTAHRNAFWRDSQGNPLIRNFESDVRLSFGLAANGTAHEAGLSDEPTPQEIMFGVPGKVMDLPMRGIYTANVTVDLANPDALEGSYSRTYELFSKLNLSMTRHTSVMVGPWAAKNPEQVRQRIDHFVLFPGGMLAPAKPLVDLAVGIVESPSCFKGGCTKGPKLGELEFWNDVVPGDRLK